jgi:hypothetical protein
LWIDKAALKLITARAGHRGVTVYAWLCYFANAKDQDCFPSMNTLAKECKVSGRTVARTIKKLAEVQAISIEHDIGKPNIYRLLDVPTHDTSVRTPLTALSGVPMTALSSEQELIEQDLLNKAVVSLFSSVDNSSGSELKALAALFSELKDRINLLAFLKKYRTRHKYLPPVTVLIKTCEQFKSQSHSIRRAWPWFDRVIKSETGSFNAARQIKEHEEIKREPMSVGAILSKLGGGE